MADPRGSRAPRPRPIDPRSDPVLQGIEDRYAQMTRDELDAQDGVAGAMRRAARSLLYELSKRPPWSQGVDVMAIVEIWRRYSAIDSSQWDDEIELSRNVEIVAQLRPASSFWDAEEAARYLEVGIRRVEQVAADMGGWKEGKRGKWMFHPECVKEWDRDQRLQGRRRGRVRGA